MKKIFFVSAAVLLLAAGCGKKQAGPYETASQKSTGQQSFRALASGKPQKCEIKFSQENNQNQGTVYVANGKMRNDSTATVSGKTMVSHMILDNNTVYTWMEGQTTGFKMQATATEEQKTDGQQKRPVDLDQKVDYSCEGWSVDGSVFVPPANITFTDFSSLIPKIPAQNSAPAAGNQNAAACAACDQVPASAQAQCKAALGCK